MTDLFYLVPAAAVAALFFAWLFFRQMMKESEGSATMKEIALYVRKGAMAYLKQQYNEDRYICFRKDGQCGHAFPEFGAEAGIPLRGCDGAYRCGPRSSGHFAVVYHT